MTSWGTRDLLLAELIGADAQMSVYDGYSIYNIWQICFCEDLVRLDSLRVPHEVRAPISPGRIVVPGPRSADSWVHRHEGAAVYKGPTQYRFLYT